MWRRLFFSLSLLVLTACTSDAPPAAPAPTPMVFQPMLGRALSFLARQFDADPGLLHVSPAQPGVHWLAPDNRLALWVFQQANANELGAKLASTLDQYDAGHDDLIETIAGAAVAWPPKSALEQELTPGVWLESQASDPVVEDWTTSADLTLFGALNAWNRGDAATASRLYADAMRLFDGTGFRDTSVGGEYATRPLALALIAGQRLGEPIDPAIVEKLRGLQRADGGFVAHYAATGPNEDADSETTAYALLAFYALRQPAP